MNDLIAKLISTANEILPSNFNGEQEKLLNFLDCLSLLKLFITEDLIEIAILLIKSKIGGLARQWVKDASSIEEIEEILKNRIIHESSKLVRALLRNTKQRRNQTAEAYSEIISKLASRLEFAFNAEGVPCAISQKLSNEFAIESLTEGVNDIAIGMTLLAGNYKSLNELIEKFIILTVESNIIGSTMNKFSKRTALNHDEYEYKDEVNNELDLNDYKEEISEPGPRIIEVSRLNKLKKIPCVYFKMNDKNSLQIIMKNNKNIILNQNIRNMITNDKLNVKEFVKVINYKASNLNVQKLQLSLNTSYLKN